MSIKVTGIKFLLNNRSRYRDMRKKYLLVQYFQDVEDGSFL